MGRCVQSIRGALVVAPRVIHSWLACRRDSPLVRQSVQHVIVLPYDLELRLALLPNNGARRITATSRALEDLNYEALRIQFAVSNML